MTEETNGVTLQDELPEEDAALVYGGSQASGADFVASVKRKTSFQPWHHPVKQVVRARQWASLTRRLIDARSTFSDKLHYFTLPGPDLLDVRVLSEVCGPLGIKVEYFGFDAGSDPNLSAVEQGTRLNAESALRQAGKISDDALILPDRLEDIVEPRSQAAAKLFERDTFDVVNIDACDNLAYLPKGRTTNTFNAIEALLKHQCRSRKPWLLFVTTRVQPGLLGSPGLQMQAAISDNLKLSTDFGSALAACINADVATLTSAINLGWAKHDSTFLKLYSVGVAKFLLQFFHNQPSVPADVTLASSYAYRVYNDEPDMLALAFRITPDPPRFFDAGTGGAIAVPLLEPTRAIRVAKQAEKLQDLDTALTNEADLRKEAIEGSKKLLHEANFDIDAWLKWLANHDRRPMADVA